MPGVDVARVLRNARDLMNTNGRHWIKGDMQVVVSESLIESMHNEYHNEIVLSPKAQVGDSAYCTWGGLREVTDDFELQVEAMEALVEIISPNGIEYYNNFYEEMYEEWKDNRYYGDGADTFAEEWFNLLGRREELLGEVIATWNDDDKRTWAEVRASLTKAAEKAKRAKVNVVST